MTADGLGIECSLPCLACCMQARAAKDFAASDRIRLELESKGVLIMDTPQVRVSLCLHHSPCFASWHLYMYVRCSNMVGPSGLMQARTEAMRSQQGGAFQLMSHVCA